MFGKKLKKESIDAEKKIVAHRALSYVEPNTIIGVGTGSTTNYFIDALAGIKEKIKGAVASSIESQKRLEEHGIHVFNLNEVHQLALYVDGADEFNELRYLTKGGGGALTREKIIASASKQFICIVDSSKKCGRLGRFPLPIEVIPMARSYVARELIKLGGEPVYRENFKTDNANIILDVHSMNILEPLELETNINQIAGVVCNGLFAHRPADQILIGETGLL